MPKFDESKGQNWLDKAKILLCDYNPNHPRPLVHTIYIRQLKITFSKGVILSCSIFMHISVLIR